MTALWQRAAHELRLFFTAVQFFTRVPVPSWVGFQPDWLQHSTRYFPVVGACVGAFGAMVMALASMWWPPAVSVILSMAATVWMTGAFHEDGWADTCDGLGGSVSRDKALLIMKDSRLGTYGALGLLLMVLLKATVLTALLTPQVTELHAAADSGIHQVLLGWTLLALVWAHTVSRLAPVVLLRWLPYAGDADHAKAKPLAMQASGATLLAAVGLSASVAGVLWLGLNHMGWPWRTWVQAMGWSTLAALAVTLLCGRWFRQRLGGFTGDTLGASQQLSEVIVLLVWLSIVHPVHPAPWGG